MQIRIELIKFYARAQILPAEKLQKLSQTPEKNTRSATNLE